MSRILLRIIPLSAVDITIRNHGNTYILKHKHTQYVNTHILSISCDSRDFSAAVTSIPKYIHTHKKDLKWLHIAQLVPVHTVPEL